MFDDIKESAKKAINDRLSNPFYGALIISWLLWNWQIPYITFFVGQDKLNDTKLNYIIATYSDWRFNILLPYLSALFITLAMPFLLGYMDEAIDFAKSYTEKRRLRKQAKIVLNNGEYLKYKYKVQLDATIKSVEHVWSARFNQIINNPDKHILLGPISKAIDNEFSNFYLYKAVMLYNLQSYSANSQSNTFIYIMKNIGYIDDKGRVSTVGKLKIDEYKGVVPDTYAEYIKLYYEHKLSDVV